MSRTKACGGVAVIIAAAGSGDRLGAGIPKALVQVAGEPLIVHAVRSIVAEDRIGLIVLTAPLGYVSQMLQLAQSAAAGVQIAGVTGGLTRSESVRIGLAQVSSEFPIVLVHDAARAFVPVSVIARVIDEVTAGAEAVAPAIPLVDTIRALVPEGGTEVIDRSTLQAVQTPQGFPADSLRRAQACEVSTSTDDVSLVEALGIPVTLVAGDSRAFKVTTPIDLLVAEAILRNHRDGIRAS